MALLFYSVPSYVARDWMVENNGSTIAWHADFLIRITRNDVKFETERGLDGVQRSLEQHAELARALSLMARDDTELTISGNSRIPSITLPLGDLLSGPYVERLPAIGRFLDSWQILLAKVGVRSGGSFNFDNIWTADETQIAVEMLLSPQPATRLEFRDFDGDGVEHALLKVSFSAHVRWAERA